MLTQTAVESPLLNLTGTVHWRDRWWLLDRLTAMLLGGSPRQKTERFLEKLPLHDCFCGVPPRNTGLRKLYELSLAVFYALENGGLHSRYRTIERLELLWYHTVKLERGTKMLIKNMEYLSQRLRCTDEEKDTCLETVTAILHFWTNTRKNGLLAIGGNRAEHDPNPFFRACLLDAMELMGSEDEPLLEELFAQYLIAGDYTGGLFLQNMVIAEGILAYLKFLHEHEDGGRFQQWGDRLSVVIGGYFGVEYREKLRKTIRREIRKWEREVKKTSFLPEFDALGSLPHPLCEKLLRDTYDHHYAYGDRTLALALKYASGAVQDHILSVLSPEERDAMEEEMDACTLVRQTDVEHAQREILERAASYESSEG